MSSNTGENNGRDKLCDDNGQQGGGSEDVVSNTNECTSCEQNNVESITEAFNSVAILDMSTCANCGKEGNSDDMNTCNKCKLVKYCNAACKKKHRTKHKKKCERRVAELHDEKLFKEHPPREECPICFLPLPRKSELILFKSCCGKHICCGCIYAIAISEVSEQLEEELVDLCPFCRTQAPNSVEERISRIRKLMEAGNAYAIYELAGYYDDGDGLPQDYQQSNELLLKAGELGCHEAYHNLGINYDLGNGVEVDKKKAKHYYELAAMGGCVGARNDLGIMELKAGNYDRAYKHFILAANAGDEDSLDIVKQGLKERLVTKVEFASALRAYHERQKEANSDARDKAAASGMFRTQW